MRANTDVVEEPLLFEMSKDLNLANVYFLARYAKRQMVQHKRRFPIVRIHNSKSCYFAQMVHHFYTTKHFS